MQDNIKAPISVCLICRNEAPRIEHLLKELKSYVEEIICIDTGSTDGTLEIIKIYADKYEVFLDCNDNDGRIENFALARNRSFELASQKYLMWVDADDLISGLDNLNSVIENFDKNRNGRPGAILFPYQYARDVYGNVRVSQYRERLFCPKESFVWVNPVHEVVIFNDPNTYVEKNNTITWIHNRGDKVTELHRNLRILEKYVAKVGESDARQLYYLGLEQFNANQPDKGEKSLLRYIELSGWDDERVMACQRLGSYYLASGQWHKAIEIAFKAISMKEEWGESYFIIGKAFFGLAEQQIDSLRNYQRCVHFIKRGLEFPPTDTLLFVDPMDRAYDVYKYLNVSQSRLGDIKAALDSCEKGLSNFPYDKYMEDNKKRYQQHLYRLEFNKQVKNLLDCQGIDELGYAKLMAVLDNPEQIKFNTELKTNHFEVADSLKTNGYDILNYHYDDQKLIINISDYKHDNKLDIIFFGGWGLEDFTPLKIAKEGIGGSETQCVELAKRLRKLGHKVRVYCTTGTSGEGIYDGVEYYQIDKFKNLSCDVLVVSRFANMLDDVYNIKTKLKLLWCHDVCAISATNKLLLKADRVLALSNWHKDFMMNYHNLHDNHIITTRNGVDINKFKNKILREIHLK